MNKKNNKNKIQIWLRKIVDSDLFKKIKSLLKKLKMIIFKFLKKNWEIILMNIIIFILTVFIESIYIYNLKFLTWVFNLILFIVVPTLIFALKKHFKLKDILLSIPILYLLFLIFLDYCTLRDLYGITNSSLSPFPSFIDALLVVFVFTFFEYITISIVNKIKYKKAKK